MGQERTVGYLPAKLPCPVSGKFVVAAWAGTLGSQTVVFDEVPVPANQRLVAVRAARIFPTIDHSRQIARVDVPKSRFTANLGGAEQIIYTRVPLVIHFVVRMKCSDVPRYVR